MWCLPSEAADDHDHGHDGAYRCTSWDASTLRCHEESLYFFIHLHCTDKESSESELTCENAVYLPDELHLVWYFVIIHLFILKIVWVLGNDVEISNTSLWVAVWLLINSLWILASLLLWRHLLKLCVWWSLLTQWLSLGYLLVLTGILWLTVDSVILKVHFF